MRYSMLALMLLVSLRAIAQAPSVYRRGVALDLDSAYQKVCGTLEEQRFWVMFEADMGARTARLDRLRG